MNSKYSRIIHTCLKNLGMPAGLIGYDYTATLCELCIESGRANANLTGKGGVYAKVGEQYGGAKWTQVERSIRHAAECTMLTGSIEYIHEVFGNSMNPDTGKLSNSNFVWGIVKYIQMVLCAEEGA